MQLILGSQSPRRKEILGYFSLPFKQVSSDFNEDSIAYNGDPNQYVEALAQAKGAVIRSKHPESTVLTADTIVFRNGKVLGKPRSRDHALEMLASLQGSWHTVYSGVTLYHNDETYSSSEATRVLFNHVSEEQRKAYLDQLHCDDKAGAYAVQMGGSIIIQRIEGCFYNVMGLPINCLVKVFDKIGISLWDHLG